MVVHEPTKTGGEDDLTDLEGAKSGSADEEMLALIIAGSLTYTFSGGEDSSDSVEGKLSDLTGNLKRIVAILLEKTPGDAREITKAIEDANAAFLLTLVARPSSTKLKFGCCTCSIPNGCCAMCMGPLQKKMGPIDEQELNDLGRALYDLLKNPITRVGEFRSRVR